MGTKQDYLLSEAKNWLDNGLIDESFHSKLLARYSNSGKWNLKILVRWILLVGSISLGVGLITLVTVMIDSLEFLSFMLSVGAIGFIYTGISMGRSNGRFYLPKTGNAFVTVGCSLLCTDVFTLAKLICPPGDHWAILLLIVSILYFLISYLTKNSIVLIMGLLALASWFGAESGYVSGRGAYFFGMNYPIRFALVTPLIILIGYLHKRFLPSYFSEFPKVYYVIGLLYFNIALWALTIFGSHDEAIIGDSRSHVELGIYSLLWFVLCIGMLLIGTRFENRAFRGFGLTFIAINMYTRFFDYFWSLLEVWVFFVLIGIITLIAGFLLERYQKRVSLTKGKKEGEAI